MIIWIVVGGILVVFVILIFDAAGRQIASLRPGCRLQKSILLRDACVGGCPNGTRCAVLSTRPYFFGLGTQAATCGCVPVAAGGTPLSPPPVSAPPGGSAGPPVEPQ